MDPAAGTQPRTAEGILAQISASVRADDNARAVELATEAIESGLQHPMLYNVRATSFWQSRQYSEALSDFESARRFSPNNPVLWNAIGNCLMRLTRWSDAVTAFESAIASAPTAAHVHHHRGIALQMLGNRHAAKAAIQAALEIRADFADALGSLALITIGEENFGEARIYAERALESSSRQSTALIALALADFQENLDSSAEEKVRDLLEDDQFGENPYANSMFGLLADVLARRGNFRLAFKAYTALHKKRREIHAARFASRRAVDNVERLTAYFKKIKPWTSTHNAGGSAVDLVGHVFLLGFARSGTTLLETVLATNGKVAVLDERDCFPAAAKELLQSEPGLDRLATLREDDLVHWRRAYWEEVRKHGTAVAGKVFVDKWPFNSHRMPLIAKLFPNAKILFALRDPRDVVLSCFCRRFVVNSDTFEFLLLDDCARFYAGVMGLAQEFRGKLPLCLHEHRYEDMIADFDTTVRAVCDFIGIDWSAKMRDFSSSAEGKIDPTAQSREQLGQGLYTGGVGQWRRFNEEFASILPILQPWVDRFGYSPN